MLPTSICNNFFNTQNKSLHLHFESEQDRLNKKLIWLYNKHKILIKKRINPVQYFSAAIVRASDVSTTHAHPTQEARIQTFTTTEYSLKPFTSSHESSTLKITLQPSSFQDPSPFPLHNQNKWFVNLTSIHILPAVQGLLQLGENFCLPINSKEKIITELIKNVDNNTNKLPANIRLTIRNRVTPIINNLINYSFTHSTIDKELVEASRAVRNFMRA